MTESTSPYAIAESESPTWKTGEQLAAAAFIGASLYLIVDINISVLRVFKKRKGLYYWSMLIGSLGCLVDNAGVILKYLAPREVHPKVCPLYTTFRVDLLLNMPASGALLETALGERESQDSHKRILIMICSTVFVFIIPTLVVLYPAYSTNPRVSSVWSPRMPS